MFNDPDRLEGDNLGKLDAWKSTRILTLPDVLIFHVKRLNYDLERCTRFKVPSGFEFGNEIDGTELLKGLTDDTGLETFPESQFESETFGGLHSHFCPYLLV
jgi:hypothetical protein